MKVFKKHTGFTLMEFLTVAAMLAMVAAILLPVFANVRERMNCRTCTSNLRQIGAGLLQYVQDNDGRFPASCEVSGWTAANHSAAGWAYLIRPYLKSSAVRRCPDDPTPPTENPRGGWSDDFDSPAKAYTSYAYNNVLGGHGPDKPAPMLGSRLQRPDLTIMALDSRPGNAWNGQPYDEGFRCNGFVLSGLPLYSKSHSCYDPALPTEYAARHGSVINIVFTDGHVKAVPSLWHIYGAATQFDISQSQATFHAADK